MTTRHRTKLRRWFGAGDVYSPGIEVSTTMRRTDRMGQPLA